MPWLTRIDSSGSVLQSWEVRNEPVVFGRGDGITATIDDEEMSRRHFEIKFVNDSHVLTDLKSSNGTWVNGRKATHSYLKSGDRIQAGKSQFQFQIGTSTMLGFVEKAAGTTFKDELKKMYDAVEKKK